MFRKIIAIGLLLAAAWLVVDGVERIQFTRQRARFHRVRTQALVNADTPATPSLLNYRPAYLRIGMGASLFLVGVLVYAGCCSSSPKVEPVEEGSAAPSSDQAANELLSE